MLHLRLYLDSAAHDGSLEARGPLAACTWHLNLRSGIEGSWAWLLCPCDTTAWLAESITLAIWSWQLMPGLFLSPRSSSLPKDGHCSSRSQRLWPRPGGFGTNVSPGDSLASLASQAVTTWVPMNMARRDQGVGSSGSPKMDSVAARATGQAIS